MTNTTPYTSNAPTLREAYSILADINLLIMLNDGVMDDDMRLLRDQTLADIKALGGKVGPKSASVKA